FVQVVGHQMDSAAGDLDAVLERASDGVHGATKRWQQGRVGIQDATWVRGYDIRGKDFVEASQYHQVNLGGLQGLQQRGLPPSAPGIGGAIDEAYRHASR